MKAVPQIDYFNMVELGWIDWSIHGRNVSTANKQKNSKAKTYYVLDSMKEEYDEYLKNQNLPKGI